MKLSSLIVRFCGVLALGLALGNSVLGQGITTSAVTGTVTDKSGKPLASTTVTIVHEPSATRSTTTTRGNGQYDFNGLRVGGPYTITANGETQRGFQLELGKTTEVNFPASAEVVKMEAFRVAGERDTTFDAGRMGAGSNYNQDEILNTASVRSDVQDIARLDSRLTLNSLDQGGQLSAQGQNFRFNSFLIDGVEANDPFGLNSNGVSSIRGPIPLEALAALSIELNPYDVRRSGFTGALINAVTASGTNEFSGSVFYEKTDDGWRAKNPRTGVRENFDEKRWGLTFRGPIWRDHLFFSLAYDDFRRESDPPQAGFLLSPASLALVDSIIARARALGYDPGVLPQNATVANVSTQKNYLGKIDWNISDSHRLSATYRKNEGTAPVFAGLTSVTGTSLSNNWYDQPRNTESWNAQFFSQWTPDIRSEVSYSSTKYDASPVNRGSPFPAIGIGGLTGTRTDTGASATGFLNFGTEFSRQLNQLTTKEDLLKGSLDYSLGDHTITLGGEYGKTKYDNRFLQAYYGSYTFNNSAAFGTTPARTGVENWLAGLPTSYTDAQPFPGNTIEQVFARWTYNEYALLLQDNWKVNSHLSVVGGLRYDIPTVSEKPPFNAAFLAAFNRRNDDTIDGNNTLAPRLGFNYKIDSQRKTELRGGIGLFQGRNPAVWLANAYQNAGTAGSITVNVNGNNQPALQFQPDITRQPIPAGTPPVPTINLTAPGFKMPSSWKGNLALDHTLPFGGLVLGLEVTGTKVNKGLFIEFLNYQAATTGPTTMPDGRIRYNGNITPNIFTNASPNFLTTAYNPATTTFPQTNTNGRRRITTFADVYEIKNTSEGSSADFTFSLNRPWKNKWSAGVSWTRGKATEVSPMTSSTAGSLYTTRAVFNPNEEKASTSNTQTRDKIVARYARQFNFLKMDHTATTLSVVYEGHTGRPYSWVFNGDANGDGFTGNDLLYVPSGPSDPKVRWLSTTERDAFFAFADSVGLTKFSGGVAPRNSEHMPWINTIDITVRQELPIFRKVHAELYVQLLNLGNLVKDEYGLLREVDFPYRRAVVGAAYDPAANAGAGQYVYVFNGNTLQGVPTVANDTSASRWQGKIGMTIKF